MDWRAYEELQSEANAAYDYVQEAFGDTRVPDDWDQPTDADLLFRAGYFGAESADGLVLVSRDYCSGGLYGHIRGCLNEPVELEEPPF